MMPWSFNATGNSQQIKAAVEAKRPEYPEAAESWAKCKPVLLAVAEASFDKAKDSTKVNLTASGTAREGGGMTLTINVQPV